MASKAYQVFRRVAALTMGSTASVSSEHAYGAAFAVLLAALLTASAAVAAEVRIRGSTTVAYGLLAPEKDRIEELTGVTLDILPSSTSHGLSDLIEGRADIAMQAESLRTLAAALNAARPGYVQVSDFSDKFIGNAQVRFIVNPKNPVRRLSREQLGALFSGKIKNWAELGGNNQPVLLVGEPTSTPHRLIREALNITYSPDIRAVQNTNQTAIIVAQAPGAISYLSDLHTPQSGSVSSIDTELKLTLPLHLVTRHDARPDVRRVVEAAASLWPNE